MAYKLILRFYICLLESYTWCTIAGYGIGSYVIVSDFVDCNTVTFIVADGIFSNVDAFSSSFNAYSISVILVYCIFSNMEILNSGTVFHISNFGIQINSVFSILIDGIGVNVCVFTVGNGNTVSGIFAYVITDNVGILSQCQDNTVFGVFCNLVFGNVKVICAFRTNSISFGSYLIVVDFHIIRIFDFDCISGSAYSETFDWG